jgi:hypothetical protein
MRFLGLIGGVAVIATILWDTFETVILPRRVTRRIRLTSLFYRSAWKPYFAISRRIQNERRREQILSLFGPLSLFILLAIWTAALIIGYALVFWGTHQRVSVSGGPVNFVTYLYLSGVTFFTLGYGDVAPTMSLGRFLSVVEAANGLGLFAVVISYLPVLYQSFSRRETSISLLDARAGSPSSAVELLRRQYSNNNFQELTILLEEWERWSAELLESHLSYPSLCYFRSQHDNQSWLRAITTVLDTCALVIVGLEESAWQARMTFAMTRHAIVDIAQVLKTKPRRKELCSERLTTEELQRVRSILSQNGIELKPSEIEGRLSELRQMYEPYVFGLSDQLLMPLPPWILPKDAIDNWKTSAWGRIQ